MLLSPTTAELPLSCAAQSGIPAPDNCPIILRLALEASTLAWAAECFTQSGSKPYLYEKNEKRGQEEGEEEGRGENSQIQKNVERVHFIIVILKDCKKAWAWAAK